MEFPLQPQGQPVAYALRRSVRARRMRIEVSTKNGVVVTIPKRMAAWQAEAFLARKAQWVFRAIARLQRQEKRIPVGGPRSDFQARRAGALRLIQDRIERLNAAYGFAHGRVSVRNQRARWGSCSRTGNLSFNYRVALLPAHLADYIVVHELCHLEKHNHSPAFWTLVARMVPTYRECRRELRGYQICHG